MLLKPPGVSDSLLLPIIYITWKICGGGITWDELLAFILACKAAHGTH